MKSQWTVGLSLTLVFLSGVAVGSFGHRLYTVKAVSPAKPESRSPDFYRKRYIDNLRTRLKLNDAQVQKLQVILDDTREQYRRFRERTKPETDAIQHQQRQKTRAILEDWQQAEYEKMLKESEGRHGRGGGGC